MGKKEFVKLSCVVFMVCCMLLVGCAHKTKQVATLPSETEQPAVKAAEQTGQNEGEFPLGQDQSARELAFLQGHEELRTIYFDFDQSTLKPDSISRLDAAAEWLKANPNAKVKIEGHCDERGTDEYNLALGERRALSARRYLISLGVNPDQIFTMSYGEERPANAGHDESAWQYNRRDEFKVAL